ncbi:DUF3237 family protein [Pseudomonas cannabina]|uniref:DUF3237 domain-containing protein n=3 Tax=Pseudomonas syringae group TaxID=136849 RepID=A0A3M3QCD1_PSECA|nr:MULTISPECIES: DUF3237 family protein [Pseudomonas syringae group]KPW20367.1 Uncharacterized protein ALO83_01542 [Pseudomonas cannabina pv. alisalensis]MBM0138144.1 DUF3237 family protein [Pseudomonas cannabina pv. alisalensis]QHE97391.1 DUF3237 family protein [Pseudomonas syringae pv. maculicola str. ES4326]QQN24355.1 DUF3237 family protein [Pseudomonas cannabina pv. alisalensis]RMN81875.1 hypothetical protein ALQ53_102996 [Pseudomonas cannabina]
METIQLHEMLTVHLHIDTPQSLFQPRQGQRSSSGILGGEFQGQCLRGTVVPGGSLFLVAQDEELVRFSLYYTLLTDDGVSIDVVGEGLTAIDGTPKQPQDSVLRIAASFSRCTCNIQFSVPAGDYQYLQTHLYIGRVHVMTGSDEMTISIFQVDET